MLSSLGRVNLTWIWTDLPGSTVILDVENVTFVGVEFDKVTGPRVDSPCDEDVNAERVSVGGCSAYIGDRRSSTSSLVAEGVNETLGVGVLDRDRMAEKLQCLLGRQENNIRSAEISGVVQGKLSRGDDCLSRDGVEDLNKSSTLYRGGLGQSSIGFG